MFKPSSLLLIAIDLPFHWDLENNSTTTISPCTARFLKHKMLLSIELQSGWLYKTVDLLNPFTPKIFYVILLTVCHTILMMSVQRIWNSLNLTFLSSHHSMAWYCIDIVRRNSVLVTHGNYRIKVSTHKLNNIKIKAFWVDIF